VFAIVMGIDFARLITAALQEVLSRAAANIDQGAGQVAAPSAKWRGLRRSRVEVPGQMWRCGYGCETPLGFRSSETKNPAATKAAGLESELLGVR
jgi:hypothetical protein